MADYTVSVDYNKGTDAVPDWTGATITNAGTGGAMEMRTALSSGSQTTTTPSASWPYINLPVSGSQVLDRVYAFNTNTTGIQVATYDGTNGKARVFRYNFNAAGTIVSSWQCSFFANNTHTNPSGGTQPPGANNDAFTNGTSGESSSKSLIKGNFYGSGMTAAGVQETPSAGSVGTAPTVTTGTAGSIITTAGDWLNTHGAWQDLAGWNDYVTSVAIPAATTAFFLYFTVIVYIAAGMSPTPGGWVITQTLQYAFS
jgi:hypothetical protein